MCPICESDQEEILINWGNYDIHKCDDCRLLFTKPLPSDQLLLKYYQGFLFKQPDPKHIQKEVSARKKELSRLFFLNGQESIAGKSFLDYGGGTGAAYMAAKEMGLEAFYFDLDEEAMQYTRNTFGLTPEYIIDDLQKTDQKFDYIFSDNVIEHVKDPIAFLKLLSSRLKPGGKLVIKTPNGSNTEIYFNPLVSLVGYQKRAIKYNGFIKAIQAYFSRFWHCDPPRHLYSFTEKSLKTMANRFLSPSLHSDVSFYHVKWFENTITKQFFSQDKHLNLVQSLLFRIVLLPVVIIESLLQVTRKVLLELNLISPGGVILHVENN